MYRITQELNKSICNVGAYNEIVPLSVYCTSDSNDIKRQKTTEN